MSTRAGSDLLHKLLVKLAADMKLALVINSWLHEFCLCGQSAVIKAHISPASQGTSTWRRKDECGALKSDWRIKCAECSKKIVKMPMDRYKAWPSSRLIFDLHISIAEERARKDKLVQ